MLSLIWSCFFSFKNIKTVQKVKWTKDNSNKLRKQQDCIFLFVLKHTSHIHPTRSCDTSAMTPDLVNVMCVKARAYLSTAALCDWWMRWCHLPCCYFYHSAFLMSIKCICGWQSLTLTLTVYIYHDICLRLLLFEQYKQWICCWVAF